MTDIVERLRINDGGWTDDKTYVVYELDPLRVEAAAEIERLRQALAAAEQREASLRAEVARLNAENDELVHIHDEDQEALEEVVQGRDTAEARAERTEARVADLTGALKLAVDHINHMAAWISKKNSAENGYSFEALGEDMPGIYAAIAPTAPEGK